MTSMWGAPLHRRWRGSKLRDPRQAKFLTLASLKWVLANRAYTPWYLVRYWRLLKFKLANPHIITRGMVFLGKGVEIHATPELAQLEIGRWVHIGDKNTIRAHEGSLRFGDKVVLGRDNVINTYLDVEFGDSVLMADWCYVCDFDHRMDDITLPIKDQGIVKSPVRIGPDTWIGDEGDGAAWHAQSGGAACWDRTRWSAATYRTTRSRSAHRPRWSRTVSWPGRLRRPSAPNWPPLWPTSNAKRPPTDAFSDELGSGAAPRPLGAVIDDRRRILRRPLALEQCTSSDVGELRYPAADVIAGRIELLALRRRVEHPEVRAPRRCRNPRTTASRAGCWPCRRQPAVPKTSRRPTATADAGL